MPIFIVSVLMGTLVYFSGTMLPDNYFIKLVVQIFVGIVTYTGINKITKIEELNTVYDLLRSLFKKILWNGLRYNSNGEGNRKILNLGFYPLKCGEICHLLVLYHLNLKLFKYDINVWKYREPGDCNMWRRMKGAGVRIGFLDKMVGKHYLEKQRWGK